MLLKNNEKGNVSCLLLSIVNLCSTYHNLLFITLQFISKRKKGLSRQHWLDLHVQCFKNQTTFMNFNLVWHIEDAARAEVDDWISTLMSFYCLVCHSLAYTPFLLYLFIFWRRYKDTTRIAVPVLP